MQSNLSISISISIERNLLSRKKSKTFTLSKCIPVPIYIHHLFFHFFLVDNLQLELLRTNIRLVLRSRLDHVLQLVAVSKHQTLC